MSLRDAESGNLSERFLRHFNIIAVNELDDTTVSTIYSKVGICMSTKLLWPNIKLLDFEEMESPNGGWNHVVNSNLRQY